MHRLIAGAQPGEDVDHFNHNTLDNRQENLIRCTHKENTQRKQKRMLGASSPYKGVRRLNHRYPNRPWQARICKDGVSQYLGNYATELEAARTYDAKAVELFGSRAVLNFPDGVKDYSDAPPARPAQEG